MSGWAAFLMELVFGLGAVTLGYIYFGYPALLWLLARSRPPAGAASTPSADAPRLRVSLIMAAHDEGAELRRKVEDVLAADYPVDRLEVVIGSDGSTDDPAQCLAGLPADRVHLLELPRVGKGRALNAAVAQATGEILVFSDVNARLAADAVERLVAPFADPEVGGVCGNQVYRAPDDGDNTGAGEGLYWRYDKWQKLQESRIGSIFAADGSLYAIRRELFVPIVDPAAADDIAISVQVPLGGRRLLFAPDAVAEEEAPSDARVEFRRKVRVTNASLRALIGLGSALFTSGFYSLELLSHKLVRHLAPLFMLATYAASVALAPTRAVYLAAAAAQTAFYLLALAGWWLRSHELGRRRPLYIPYFFCFANAAALVGILSVVRGQRYVVWQPRAGAVSDARPASERSLGPQE